MASIAGFISAAIQCWTSKDASHGGMPGGPISKTARWPNKGYGKRTFRCAEKSIRHHV